MDYDRPCVKNRSPWDGPWTVPGKTSGFLHAPSESLAKNRSPWDGHWTVPGKTWCFLHTPSESPAKNKSSWERPQTVHQESQGVYTPHADQV